MPDVDLTDWRTTQIDGLTSDAPGPIYVSVRRQQIAVHKMFTTTLARKSG
jgi:hypothetical protein